MSVDQLIALIVLALTGSFTPGPNNTIATVTGAHHGLRAAVPHILGVPFGLSTMLIAGGLGAAALIVTHPVLGTAIKWIGVAYLLVIAWQIARAGAPGDRALARPFTFWQSAAFQYANPKAWMLAAATVGACSAGDSAGDSTAARIVIVCAVFSVACAASLIVWAAAGEALKSWLREGRRLRRFNLTMGALLAATAAWMATT